MSSERADQPAVPASQHGNPGPVLAAQREAMGWTVEQVADQLKLAVRQVVALEAGDYAALPSPAVTRGFVRAYAKLMRLDPAPLVSQIAIETVPTVESGSVNAPRRASPTSFSQSRFPSHGKRSKLPFGLIAAAIVVVAAGAGAWHFGLIPGGQHSQASDATTVATPAPAADAASSNASSSGSATETLQNPAVPLISVPGASTAAAPAASTTASPVVAPPATARAPAVVAPAPLAAAPAATATTARTATAAPSGANALVLNVREDSWVEVKPSKGGAALLSRLVKGGSTETINVDGPVRVTVGNPTGVSATLRGAPVALPPVPGKTISRVNLE